MIAGVSGCQRPPSPMTMTSGSDQVRSAFEDLGQPDRPGLLLAFEEQLDVDRKLVTVSCNRTKMHDYARLVVS